MWSDGCCALKAKAPSHHSAQSRGSGRFFFNTTGILSLWSTTTIRMITSPVLFLWFFVRSSCCCFCASPPPRHDRRVICSAIPPLVVVVAMRMKYDAGFLLFHKNEWWLFHPVFFSFILLLSSFSFFPNSGRITLERPAKQPDDKNAEHDRI